MTENKNSCCVIAFIAVLILAAGCAAKHPQARPNCAGYVLAAADKNGDGSTAFEADALNVRDFAGIFILLGVGMAVSSALPWLQQCALGAHVR